MSIETMRFSSYFLAKKSTTVLFDLIGLGFPTFSAIVKITWEGVFTECGSQCLKSALCSHWSCW